MPRLPQASRKTVFVGSQENALPAFCIFLFCCREGGMTLEILLISSYGSRVPEKKCAGKYWPIKQLVANCHPKGIYHSMLVCSSPLGQSLYLRAQKHTEIYNVVRLSK